jgi:hypothetical protein
MAGPAIEQALLMRGIGCRCTIETPAANDRPDPRSNTVPVSTARTATVRTRPLLVRRIDGAEVPAAGIWDVATSSGFAIAATNGSAPAPLRIVDGSLTVDPRPEESALELRFDGGLHLKVSPASIRVPGNAHGLSDWPLTGVVGGAGEDLAVSLVLSYHGVFRYGDNAWARFAGVGSAAATDTTRRLGRGRKRAVVADLLFAAPRADEQLDGHVAA